MRSDGTFIIFHSYCTMYSLLITVYSHQWKLWTTHFTDCGWSPHLSSDVCHTTAVFIICLFLCTSLYSLTTLCDYQHRLKSNCRARPRDQLVPAANRRTGLETLGSYWSLVPLSSCQYYLLPSRYWTS